MIIPAEDLLLVRISIDSWYASRFICYRATLKTLH